MAKIRFENGTVVNFDGNPTPQDVEEVAQKIGISKPTQPETEKETPWIEGNRVVGDESMGQLIGKGFSNIVPSTARMAKGLVYDLPKMAIEASGALIKDPIGSISKIPAIGGAILEQTGFSPQARARDKALKDILAGKSIKEVLSDPQFLEAETTPLTNLAKMGIEDPVGTALLAEGAIQNVPILKKGVEKAGKFVEAGIKAPFKGAGKVAEIATAQATGFDPKTLKTISQFPEEFKFGQKGMTREQLSENVFSKLSKRLDELKDTGIEYGAIRKQTNVVDIPEGFFEKELSRLGLNIEKGKVVRSPASPPISAGDAKKLEDFLQVYGKSKTMTPAEFLNTRQFLSDLSEFGADKTDHLNMMARQIRNNFNEIGQDKIDGLTKLDAKFADEMSELSKVKKDYFNFDGTLKDGSINKLANLTGKGKDRILERLENVIPDVRKQIDVVKAFEDMEAVKGQKVGSYIRAGLGVGGIATGNPIMIAIGALGLSPELSSQMIKYSQQGAKGISQFFDDLNNLRIKNIIPKSPRKQLKMQKGSFTPFEDINPKQTLSNNRSELTDPLLQEARKYKTAEEFVKAQGTPVYHGTYEKGAINFDKSKLGVNRPDFLSNLGFHFTPNKKMADNLFAYDYGGRGQGQTIEAVLNIKKPLKITETDLVKDIISYGKEKGTIPKSTADELLKRPLWGKTTDIKDITHYIYRVSKQAPEKARFNIKQVAQDYLENLKKQGYDGIQYKNEIEWAGDNRYDFIAFEPSQIKTKSQLTDIWEKANSIKKVGQLKKK